RTTRHRMNLRDDHASKSSGLGVADADVIVVIDQQVPWIPVAEEPATGTYVAVVGNDPIATRIPVYEFRANLRAQCDIRLFLIELLETMRSLRTADQRSRHDARRRHYQDRASEAAAAQRDRQSRALTRTVPS